MLLSEIHEKIKNPNADDQIGASAFIKFWKLCHSEKERSGRNMETSEFTEWYNNSDTFRRLLEPSLNVLTFIESSPPDPDPSPETGDQPRRRTNTRGGPRLSRGRGTTRRRGRGLEEKLEKTINNYINKRKQKWQKRTM